MNFCESIHVNAVLAGRVGGRGKRVSHGALAQQHRRPRRASVQCHASGFHHLFPARHIACDFLGKDRELVTEEGGLLAVMSAGAYGATMSSNYNTRPRAAEVLVSGDTFRLIRQRDTFAQQIANECDLLTKG